MEITLDTIIACHKRKTCHYAKFCREKSKGVSVYHFYLERYQPFSIHRRGEPDPHPVIAVAKDNLIKIKAGIGIEFACPYAGLEKMILFKI